MKEGSGILLTLAGYFALMSLFAIGGGNAALPEMHRFAVEERHWMTDRQFADMFAIAQVTPGPNALIVALIGYQVAGIAGAAVATLAMCGPACLLAFYVSGVWNRFRTAPWRVIIEGGIVPVSVGLIGSTALVIAQAAALNWRAVALMAVTAVATLRTHINPLWIFAAAALLGLFGAI